MNDEIKKLTHEITNSLFIIHGYVNLIKIQESVSETLNIKIDKINTEINKANDLLKKLRNKIKENV